MFSNANSLPRLNVKVVAPIIHMHLYPNYKPAIKKNKKLNAHEARKINE
jgi:hypothetical protein